MGGIKTEDKNERKKQKVVKLADLSNYEEGALTSKSVEDTNAVSIVVYAFNKFHGILEDTLPYDALFVVLEGEAEVNVSGNPYMVRAGEMIKFDANKPHSVSPNSKFKMMLISLKK